MVAYQIPKVVPPEETPMILNKSKQSGKKKRKKRKKERKKSKFFKPHEVKGHHKSVHQAVLTKGKYPSTPKATPKQ
jgi:hypothetical protein